jgi:cell division protein FtsL
MSRVYVSVKRDAGQRKCHTVLIVILSTLIFAAGTLFTRAAYHDLRETLLERLRKEREAAETNGRLKLELAAITRARFVELKAKEKLGLKKPKEEEVLVLR